MTSSVTLTELDSLDSPTATVAGGDFPSAAGQYTTTSSSSSTDSRGVFRDASALVDYASSMYSRDNHRHCINDLAADDEDDEDVKVAETDQDRELHVPVPVPVVPLHLYHPSLASSELYH